MLQLVHPQRSLHGSGPLSSFQQNHAFSWYKQYSVWRDGSLTPADGQLDDNSACDVRFAGATEADEHEHELAPSLSRPKAVLR